MFWVLSSFRSYKSGHSCSLPPSHLSLSPLKRVLVLSFLNRERLEERKATENAENMFAPHRLLAICVYALSATAIDLRFPYGSEKVRGVNIGEFSSLRVRLLYILD